MNELDPESSSCPIKSLSSSLLCPSQISLETFFWDRNQNLILTLSVPFHQKRCTRPPSVSDTSKAEIDALLRGVLTRDWDQFDCGWCFECQASHLVWRGHYSEACCAILAWETFWKCRTACKTSTWASLLTLSEPVGCWCLSIRARDSRACWASPWDVMSSVHLFRRVCAITTSFQSVPYSSMVEQEHHCWLILRTILHCRRASAVNRPGKWPLRIHQYLQGGSRSCLILFRRCS